MTTAPARRGPKPGPPAYHRARRLILEHLRAHGPATLRELEAASGARGSTLAHHVGVLKIQGRVRRVWGARPTRIQLAEGTR